MATAHNAASRGDFAKTVLMPGDPLRAKFIAENFLTDARLVNNVRSVQGYTGTYKGVPVSVMASGMGMPSMGIYAYELFTEYDVENILRIGSAGAISPTVAVRDIILAMGACTNSNFAAQYGLHGTFAPVASYPVLHAAIDACDAVGACYHVGSVLTSDTFYTDDTAANDGWRQMGILAVEMETAALYMTAARLGRRALAICTVSDSLVTGEALPAEERQTSFTEMMEIALRTAVTLHG